MKPRVLSIILIFSLALNLAVLGTYVFQKIDGPSEGKEQPPFGPQGAPFFNNMDLEQEQREQLLQQMQEFRQQNDENRRIIFELEDELFKAVADTEFDSTLIDSLIDKIGMFRTEQIKHAIKHFRKAGRFLSPEQRAHFHRMIMERPGMREKRFHRWRESRGKRDMHRKNRPGKRPDSMDGMN